MNYYILSYFFRDIDQKRGYNDPNRDRQRNRSTSSNNSLHSYNNEIKTAEEIQQFLSSKKTEKPVQTSGSASNSNQTTDVFGFISSG